VIEAAVRHAHTDSLDCRLKAWLLPIGQDALDDVMVRRPIRMQDLEDLHIDV
jgi:hypothetical protein